MQTFVIADIHGWPGPLSRLLDKIRPQAKPGDTLVFLGDYIDRGPHSREVIEEAIAEKHRWPGPEDENGIYVHRGMPRGGHPCEFKAEILVWMESDGINYRLHKPVIYGH